MINQLIQIRNAVSQSEPLIHCITNPISINDCANAVLAVGAKPIMAEHPLEVADITASAKALCVNLGNITDVRMKSMIISGKVAKENGIPSIIDLVGVGCSKLRKDFGDRFIRECSPSVIKGNITEIKSLCIDNFSACGVDENSADKVTSQNISENAMMLKRLSLLTNSVIVATGETDLIAFHNDCYAINNGCRMLSRITGTGCILNVLIGCFITERKLLEGAILATCMLGIAGELSSTEKGTGTFRVNLMDNLSAIDNKDLSDRIRIKEV